MKSKNFFKLTALLATFLTTEIYATGVVVEAEDQSYLFEVNENDRFCDIMNAIDMALYGQPYHHSSMEKIIQIKMSQHNYSKGLQTTNASAETIRDYSAGITEEEANEIVYIIKTMANSNLIKLKSAESSLKKAGDRIDHIHPLYFLSTIFCNEELTVCVRNIKGRLFVWKGFLNGAVNTLIEEDKKNNVAPYIEDFAKRVNVDKKILIPLQKAGKWEKFIVALIENVQRDEAKSGRYNQ